MIQDRLQALALRQNVVVDAELEAKARLVLSNVVSRGTDDSYVWYFSKFADWCSAAGVPAFPAPHNSVVRFFLNAPLSYTAGTLEHFRTAIRMLHLRAGFDDPTRGDTIDNAITARRKATGGPVPKSVLYLDELLCVVNIIGTSSLRDLRDRAILLDGYLGPLRLHHLQGLRRERIMFRDEDALLYFDDSVRPIIRIVRVEDTFYCPVAALQLYLQAAGIKHGFVFVDCNDEKPRRKESLRVPAFLDIIRTRCQDTGLVDKIYSTDSLRAGFVVSGHEAGVRESDLMIRTGLSFNAVRRFRKFVRSKKPKSASYLGL